MSSSGPYFGARATWGGWCRYAAPALLYALGNNLRIYSTVMIGPPLYVLLTNTRILFAALLGMWLFGQKFTQLQWAGLANLVLACVGSRLFKVFACTDAGAFGGEAGAGGRVRNRGLLPAGVDQDQAPALGVPPGAAPGPAPSLDVASLGRASIALPGAPLDRLGGGASSVVAALPAFDTSFDPSEETQEHLRRARDSVATLLSWSGWGPASSRSLEVASTASTGTAPSNLAAAVLQTAAPVSPPSTPEALPVPPSSVPAQSLDFVFCLGLVLVLLCGLISGSTGAVNEFLLKNVDESVTLWRKNMYMYQWGVIFNMVSSLFLVLGGVSSPGAVGREKKSAGGGGGVGAAAAAGAAAGADPADAAAKQGEDLFASLFAGTDTFLFWLQIAGNVSFGLSVSLVLRYFDNVVKCIGGVAMILFTAVMTWWIFDEAEHVDFGLSCGLFMVSIFLYSTEWNQVLNDKAAEKPVE